MNSSLSKAITLGFFVGIVGLMISLSHFILDIEENIGLGLLFKLRGVRQAPSDVIIASIDKESADNLNLPDDPEKWPRSLHARFIENLAREGAKIIAFDLLFEEPRSTWEDNSFADAISKARNVVLCESLEIEQVPLSDKAGFHTRAHRIVKIAQPITPLMRSAVASAPFPLPKVPVKVSQYWTFKTGAGDVPTLPIVAFQLFTMQAYEEFIHLLEKISPHQARRLPRDSDAVITTRGVKGLVRRIREIFDSKPPIAERMLEELQASETLSVDVKTHQMIISLIKMYQAANSQYLNFYGPSGTITTIPYHHILQLHEKAVSNKQLDLKGKAVFVGLVELSRPEKKDRFYTVFSQPNGIDLSGVEIAATAFANLVEDMPVKPLRLHFYVFTILIWGVLIGIICRLFRTGVTTLGMVGLSVFYLVAAEYQFKTNGSWYPIVIPLFFQTPLALFGAVLWKYIDSSKERQNLRKAFGYYLPNNVVDQLAKNIANIKTANQVVYGICLCTDAEQYTSLSESMDPKELGSFINRYYETVFKPVKQYDGVVSDVIGDSMLALWVATHPETTLREKSCFAALEVIKAVQQFNQSSDTLKLKTRIGLHSGHLLLGHIGAIDHYEYRPVGDIVNTAARIENLNKHLGTRLLLSEEVIHQLDGFLTRELGKFRLVGKLKPIVIYELICRMEESDKKQRSACGIFAEALGAFRGQHWDEAIEKFYQSIENFGEDGPSLFYVRLCEYYKKNPPGESCDGVVHMDKK